MSFERFGSSDVYIFEHAGGFIQCCGCSLVNPESGELFGFAELKTPREALVHLAAHEKAGDDIGGAKARIKKTYKNLDAPIEPYVRSEEEKTKTRERLMEKFVAREDERKSREAEIFIDGYAHCYAVAEGVAEEVLGSINTVMGIYMSDDMGRYEDRIKELSLIYTSIRYAYSKFDDAYFEAMDRLKAERTPRQTIDPDDLRI